LIAIFCRCRDDPAAANPAIPLRTLRWIHPMFISAVESVFLEDAELVADVDRNDRVRVRRRRPAIPAVRWSLGM
jgi:hypothetical protein